jgi:hypothetical protein
MTRAQARKRANNLWYRRANPKTATLGDRFGTSSIRRKTIANRFEVGFIELVRLRPKQWRLTTLASGASFEAAFESVRLARGGR